jgi:hypothetical protein
MKTKFIVISLGAILTVAIIFLVSKQETAETPEAKNELSVTKITPKETTPTASEPVEATKQVAVATKGSPIGKMPDPSDKAEMEEFFNKAFLAWNDKVSSLIINELKLGQDALDKYASIRDDFYQSQFTLFQVQTSQEPHGTENKEGQRRLASALNKTKDILEKDHGINLDEDELSKEDEKKVQAAVQKAMNADASNFKNDHLKKLEKVLGKDGFQKYEKLKNDFNNEITEDGAEPLFKI